jgi:ribokinase
VSVDLAVTTPAFLDLTFVGLEALPGPGEERFAGDLVRSPGGGAITAVAAARLGLKTALVAPLGDDLAGNFVRLALEAEGVAEAGWKCRKTPETVVMPVRGDQAMVTVDPGVRARSADVAALTPRAVAANLDQLDILPDHARAYLTCGDDDARAFAGRLPSTLDGARALFLNEPEARVVTGAGSVEEAAERLGEAVETVAIGVNANSTVVVTGRKRIEAPVYEIGPAVDTTGDRDLLCAAYAWADLHGSEPEDAVAWAVLYAALAASVPTATGGAVAQARLLEEGSRRGLTAPPGTTA